MTAKAEKLAKIAEINAENRALRQLEAKIAELRESVPSLTHYIEFGEQTADFAESLAEKGIFVLT